MQDIKLRLATHLIDRWHSSVVFKLSATMILIVLFVATFQATVGLQLLRLNRVETSINDTSVPLLHETQKFARLTTQVLSQTSLLENDLTAEELTELRRKYYENKRRVDDVLSGFLSSNLAEDIMTEFQVNRLAFSRINEELFSNQFRQRVQEADILQSKAEILVALEKMRDALDQLLIRLTAQILTPLELSNDGATAPQTDLTPYLIFAGEIEVLNTLRSNVLDIGNMLEHATTGQDIDALNTNLQFRLRNIGQSLILLEDNDDRVKLAQLASGIREFLSRDGRLIVLLKANATTRERFDQLKRSQAAAVRDIDRKTDKFVAEAKETFQRQIIIATDITGTIMWIGLATTVWILAGIYFINRNVIRRQISERFTKLTQDVVAISDGDYAREIRVSGRDEIGAIASALDVFKGQAGELQRSNAELEEFAYVAAHDLRSPLDAIQDLARWTLEDEREHLSESCIHNLELLIKRSLRLSALQSDLLTYAKVGEMDTAVETLDLADEVSKLADLLDPNSNYGISLKGNPGHVTTFGLPARQILLNLVTNAIKHHDKPNGQISIHYEPSALGHRLTVEDDGPGIEPRFQKKIFELFKTLQSRDVVEGSGLGLALVSKLIERLNGRLSVHSDAPKTRGCKFIFEIADLRLVNTDRDIAA